jgi:3-hydroxyacyl-CoA dehydrogenase/enoyl-CoA hydratase/3-hydroxybutyryl-CoA epimerase
VLGLPTPEDNPLMRLVSQKKLGKKSGEGFYKWAGGKAQKMAVSADPADLEELGRELVKPLIDECEHALAEGVVASADHVDAGVIFGTGFAPFRGGPLHYREAQKQAAPAEQPAAHAAE